MFLPMRKISTFSWANRTSFTEHFLEFKMEVTFTVQTSHISRSFTFQMLWSVIHETTHTSVFLKSHPMYGGTLQGAWVMRPRAQHSGSSLSHEGSRHTGVESFPMEKDSLLINFTQIAKPGDPPILSLAVAWTISPPQHVKWGYLPYMAIVRGKHTHLPLSLKQTEQCFSLMKSYSFAIKIKIWNNLNKRKQTNKLNPLWEIRDSLIQSEYSTLLTVANLKL